jgi:hypothetical protein
MKINGFHASTSGGKKVMAVSLILTLVLASISVISAFAAPTPKSSSAQAFGSQLRELDTDRTWFNSVRSQPSNFISTSDPTKAQQYLAQYAFALGQAEAVVKNGGATTTNNQSAQQNLATWLHVMHGLQDKLSSIGFSNTSSSTVAGAGVPVTGDSSSTSSSSSSSTGSSAAPTATPTTSSSSSSSAGSSATPTTTPSTGSSSSSTSSNTSGAAIPNTGGQASTLNNTVLAKVWGVQFRDLEAARAWYNNFRLNPANLISSSDPAKTQQWLDQYAFALRQADAIIVRGSTALTNNNNNNQSNTSGERTSAQQDLATWLHMMRDLQVKLTSGTNG